MTTAYRLEPTSDGLAVILPPTIPVERLPATLQEILSHCDTAMPLRILLEETAAASHTTESSAAPPPPGDPTVALARALGRAAQARGMSVTYAPRLEAAMAVLSQPRTDPNAATQEGFFARFGRKTIDAAHTALDHAAFLGEVCVCLIGVLRHPTRLRASDTVAAMRAVGVDAVPIVGLIGFLLGLIMAFMSAVQLAQFGANIYVASLVALAMVRELGPIMTAIVVAGRSGSAFAAEIGTMRVSEEVDALITMGFDPVRFLVLPKLVASALVVPLLALYASAFAIAGGLVVGVFMLDLTPTAYMQQTFRTLALFDVVWGFFKSGLFAVLIALVGCHRGFAVRGGAESVGRATTSAVVTSIFLIIFVDSVLAVILRYWR